MAQAEFGEPEIQEIIQPKNLFDEGYRRGLGFSFGLNDFGFGAGMQYRIGLSPYTEGIVNLKIAGLRDPSEQTHIDLFFGNRTIASKYQRIVTFPLTFGIKRRLFAPKITDNFRVHTSLSMGPTYALRIPYFNDQNENGFREDRPILIEERDFPYNPERINDIFQGWSDAKGEFGWVLVAAVVEELIGLLCVGDGFGFW